MRSFSLMPATRKRWLGDYSSSRELPPGLEHRIDGLEAANGAGNISYEPGNHDLMVHGQVAPGQDRWHPGSRSKDRRSNCICRATADWVGKFVRPDP